MKNIKQIINSHNSALLQVNPKTAKECNCLIREDCPLERKCLSKSTIHQATVETADEQTSQSYIRLTDNIFKTRHANHKSSFKHAQKRSSTELSKHIQSLKENNIDFNIKQKIIKKATSFNCSTYDTQPVLIEEILYHLNASDSYTRQAW